MTSNAEDVFSLTKEDEAAGVTGRMYIPKIISQGPAKEWIERRRLTIRPWASFIDQKRFSRPKNFGEMCKRLVKNVEYFQSNYVFVFLGLIVYCVITSPMLLIALVVFFGACYIVHLRAAQSRLILFVGNCIFPAECYIGRELSPAHQYGVAGAVSFPFFWIAGAGSAVFWVLGATLVIIGGHAGFHELESAEGDELQMESV